MHFWKVFWILFVVKQSLNIHQITPLECKVAMFVFSVAEDIAGGRENNGFSKSYLLSNFSVEELKLLQSFHWFSTDLSFREKKRSFCAFIPTKHLKLVVLWVLKCESLPNGSKLIFTFVSDKSCSVLEMPYGWCYPWRGDFSWETLFYSTINEV